MDFTTAIFSRYSGADTSKQTTDANWNVISSALASLAGNSLVAKFFSSLPSAVGAIAVRCDPSAQMNAFRLRVARDRAAAAQQAVRRAARR